MRYSAIRTVFILLLVCGVIGGWTVYSEVHRASTSDEALTFTIENGQGVREIGSSLFDSGVIRSELVFRRYVSKKGIDKQIQAGTYTVEPPVTLARVVAAMNQPTFEEFSFTVIPGWSMADVANRFEKDDIASAKQIAALVGEAATEGGAGKPSLKLPSLKILQDKPKNISLEGYIRPDTFRFFADASAEDILIKLLTERDKEFTDKMYKDIKLAGRSVHEVMTIASVVEREVRGAKDKAIVADIFWKRVDNGWGLQADSTVHFLTGGTGSVFTSAADRNIDSPWNTYKYAGLPPGPISNPSIESIMAAIYPEKNGYWYFLTTLDTGEVKYGSTLDQHNANVAKYLR
ncbi:MAG: endolytic transglycosylase MltG [Candidatus Magasanikbacteria bacterium]|jgi:UPF0755 protein|nr:endolytic transglycosylase MltG [Candidatus Magasanikbacteria bacterium]